MPNIFFKIKKHRHFLTFILLFAYVKTVQERFSYRGEFNAYLFTPEAAVAELFAACILFLIIRFLLSKWQKQEPIEIKKLAYIFTASIIIYYAVMVILGLIIAFLFDTFERNFNSTTLILNAFSYVLNALIYGGFYLTYYYYRNNKAQQESLAKYNQALAESKIMQLKNQINPHFLFNNLNVLDQLIEEDKTTASHFLNDFADLYRMVLEVSDKKIIALNEEIAFAKKYFNLIKRKFGAAYSLEIDSRTTEGYIVPMTMQLLLENVMKHNIGTQQNPVKIKVKVDTNITVVNTLKPKAYSQLSSGKALNNLKAQYDLLSNQKIDILSDKTTFTVIIPLIKKPQDDKSTTD